MDAFEQILYRFEPKTSPNGPKTPSPVSANARFNKLKTCHMCNENRGGSTEII